MRRSVLWALLASVVLSAIALFTQQPPQIVAAIEPRMQEHSAALSQVQNYNNAAPTVAGIALPVALPDFILDPAQKDIFAPEVPPAPKVQAPAPQPVPIAVVAPPAPQAPAINLRFTGRMQTPDGKPLVYLARGDTAFAVSVGDKLEEGYVVESMDKGAVVLLYPTLDQRVRIPIPPTPSP